MCSRRNGTERIVAAILTALALAAACTGGGTLPIDDASFDAGLDLDGGRATRPDAVAPKDAGVGPEGASATSFDSSLPPEAASSLDAGGDGGVSFAASFTPPIQVAVSDDGSAFLISATAGTSIRYAHFEPGQGWTAGADVPSALGSWAGDTPPRVGMDGAGNAFLAWTTLEADAGGLRAVRVARYDHTAQTWGAALALDAYDDQTSSSVALDVSPAGNAIVLNTHIGSTAAHAINALYYAAGTWDAETVLARDQSILDAPSAARVLDDGRALVLWTGSAGVGVALRDTMGTWTAQTDFAPIGAGDFMATALDSAGAAILPYFNGATYAYDSAGDDAGWTGPVTLSATQGTPTYVAATMATAGDAVFTRAYKVAATPVAESFVYAGAPPSWQAAQTLVVGAFDDLAVAYDDANDALAIWVSLDGSSGNGGHLYTSSYTQAGGWTAPSGPLSDLFSETNQSVALAMSPNGLHAWAAWSENGAAHVLELK